MGTEQAQPNHPDMACVVALTPRQVFDPNNRGQPQSLGDTLCLVARGIRGSPTGHPIHVTVQDGAQGKTPCRREGTPHRASVSPDMKALLAAGRNAAGSFPGRHPAPRLTPPGARRQRCFQTGPSGSCGTAPAHPPHALAQGRGHPVTGMQASPSLLQAPTGLLVPQEPSQKAFGNPPCGAPASIPHCHRAPHVRASSIQLLPSGMLGHPQALKEGSLSTPVQAAQHRNPPCCPPCCSTAISIHYGSDDPSAGSRQVEAGSCLPCASPDSAPRGLIPACKY